MKVIKRMKDAQRKERDKTIQLRKEIAEVKAERDEIITIAHNRGIKDELEIEDLKAERDRLRADLDLYKEAYTMACSRVKLYSQKHDRDWEAYHLRAARTALEASE